MDQVYTAKIDPEKLSTKFEDWIEKDLLKIKPFDVDRLKIRDYSVVRFNQGFQLDPRMDVSVQTSEGDNKWKLTEFMTYNKTRKPQPSELLPDEELNNTKLDELKNSLDKIKIVSVVRKPKGLGADLRAGKEFLENQENVDSLFVRGFFPDDSSGTAEIRAANGELRVGTKDGVDYALRFGNVAGADDSKSTDAKVDELGSTKLTRYLFVVAQIDESRFPEPQLEQIPELPEGSDPSEDKPAENKPEENKPADGTTPDKSELKKDEKSDEKGGDCGQEKKEDSSKTEPAKADADKPAPVNADNPDVKKPDATNPADAPKVSDAEKLAKIKSERERIVKENKRKQDEHKEKRSKAEEKVRELNARFADWYYVISEDAYKKVHLGRGDIVKEREAVKDEGFGVDAFRKLESEGVEKKAVPSSNSPPPGFPPGLQFNQ